MTSKRKIGLLLLAISVVYLVSAMAFSHAFSARGPSTFSGFAPAWYVYIGIPLGIAAVLMILLGAGKPKDSPPRAEPPPTILRQPQPRVFKQ